eukprot:TRINITY_DN32262_c0_g1_i1.p1 TRINITY_DN32262_c0_g1~~TRINITY_DN32262_c0_g1_i1.p1  ORF type:complete len:191 (+),score=56.19 TRINITY_DN32262_c0_g1_i1:68-574(+)
MQRLRRRAASAAGLTAAFCGAPRGAAARQGLRRSGGAQRRLASGIPSEQREEFRKHMTATWVAGRQPTSVAAEADTEAEQPGETEPAAAKWRPPGWLILLSGPIWLGTCVYYVLYDQWEQKERRQAGIIEDIKREEARIAAQRGCQVCDVSIQDDGFAAKWKVEHSKS